MSGFGLKPIKTLIYWSTNQTRLMVRKVLEPHPDFGLHQQDIYEAIHKEFPDAKQPLLPKAQMPAANGIRNRRGKFAELVPEPPNMDHPIRSMKYVLLCTTKSLD